MQPHDLSRLVTLGPPTLAPDGTTAIVSAARPDLDEDEYRSQLWTITLDATTDPTRLTRGTRDSAPQFSPDGRWLAFLRTPEKGKPQLHLLPTAGGDPRPITDQPLGVSAYAWSPDSTRLAFAARVPEPKRYGQDDDVPPEKEPPRRVTGLKYRRDGLGFTTDRRVHLFVVSVADSDERPEAHQLTDGDWDDADPAWSPDGATIAFASSRHEGREHDHVSDIFTVPAGGGDPTRVSDETLSLGAPAYTPDGATILTIGEVVQGQGIVASNGGVYALDTSAPGTPRRLTDAESLHVVGERIVMRDGDALVLVEDRGAVHVLAVPYDEGAPTPLTAGDVVVTGLDAGADTVVVTYGDARFYAEAGVVDDAGAITQRTGFTADLAVLPITELTASAADGQQLHGFVVEPDGDGPHPVLLMIHGGPFAQYTWRVFDEAQVYAAAGFAVVYTNPRGSSGYGESYGRHIVGDVGARSTDDLLALLDEALQRPTLDSDRVGVLGGSHGGFMTNWLIGHTDRFRAAVSERAVNAIDSFTGSSDIGWSFADDLYGPDKAGQHEQSPLTYAENIRTPLLIIHSEHDWRCPIEQAQRLYVALRNRDATVEMLLFPGEGHELSRSGLPSHRVARFEAILDWFGRYLG